MILFNLFLHIYLTYLSNLPPGNYLAYIYTVCMYLVILHC